ncbi:MAG: acetylglutamate kinase [Bdellovibrionales bacterium]|nr:acetylglutamate kinase [Bdellovibrionales bacterium]
MAPNPPAPGGVVPSIDQHNVKKVTVVKIGGNVLDNPTELQTFLKHFAAIEGPKILVHGGGKLATEIAEKMGIPQKMVEGRRVTDEATLKVITMVYAGDINKHLVAQLFGLGCRSVGVCGVDGDLIRSKKRAPTATKEGMIDYGFVGDITHVKDDILLRWLWAGVAPVIAPITHDGAGQLLNTNADTIAKEIAASLATSCEVTLVYSFEKPGVMTDVSDDLSVIPRVTPCSFEDLKRDGKVFAGMIPKLENACKSLKSGVKRVVLGRSKDLPALIAGTAGTTVVGEQ